MSGPRFGRASGIETRMVRRSSPRTNVSPRRRRFSFARLARLTAAAVVVAVGGALAAGFGRYVEAVSSMRSPSAPRADAIVVLTGAAGRIADAIALLEAGGAGRLLISGVHE